MNVVDMVVIEEMLVKFLGERFEEIIESEFDSSLGEFIDTYLEEGEDGEYYFTI